jgi:Domain of unknown function (DUF4383)
MAKTPQLMAVQGAAIIVAGAFLVVGVLGFLPGVTSHHDQLQFAGHHSGARLFGVFAVSILHNLLHMAFGVVGLVMARTYALARAYFLIGGLVYLGLWVYGILVDHGSPANVIPLNSADNWLHFGLGVAMMLLGLTLAGQHDPTKSRRRTKARA